MISCCTVEEFQALEAKAYRNIPRALLRAAIKVLPGYALEVYFVLFDLSKLNTRHPGTVVISHAALAKEVDKSESSVRRALNALTTLGFIEIKQRGLQCKNYLPNILRVGCPAEMVEAILNEEPDRAALNVPFSSISGKKQTQYFEEAVPNLPKDERMKPESPNANDSELHQRYLQTRKSLLNEGLSPLVASQKAFEVFSKVEASIIQTYILEQSNLPRVEERCSEAAEGCSKLNTIRINNNNSNSLLLSTIGENENLEEATKNSTVGFVNKSSTVGNELAYFLKPEERLSIIKKLKWMNKQVCEIHPILKARYQNIDYLIEEVIFHVVNRNIDKVPTYLHALRAACKLIKNGTWTTPKRLVQTQIHQREQAAISAKQLEIQSIQEMKANWEKR